jgi:hypothetical protein
VTLVAPEPLVTNVKRTLFYIIIFVSTHAPSIPFITLLIIIVKHVRAHFRIIVNNAQILDAWYALLHIIVLTKHVRYHVQ